MSRALWLEIVINLMQRMPQLMGWHTLRTMAAFGLEDMHDLADPLERERGNPSVAVPDPPVQALDLCDDRCLGSGPTKLEENMVVSIESYIGDAGGANGVELEQQTLITASRAEVMSRTSFIDAIEP